MRSLWSFVLVIMMTVALAKPARAIVNPQSNGNLVIAGVAAAGAAAVVVIAVLVIHNRHKYETVSGCVIAGGGTVAGKTRGTSAGTPMSLKDEKDLRIYTLTGNLRGVRVGDQMTLAGKGNTEAGTFVFDVKKITADPGLCRP